MTNNTTEEIKTENSVELHRFKRPKKPIDQPLISIRDGRFHFNAHLARLAELKGKRAVLYSIDDATPVIGFEFLDNSDDENAYTIGGHTEKGWAGHFHCRAGDLLSAKAWIKSVEQQSSPRLKRFRARKDGRNWIIQFVPSFEFTIQRNQVGDIPANLRGIYRYRTESGNIVYIGKGFIRGRAAQPERATWKFAAVDYSVVESEEIQYSSEHFWIEQL
jgi:hypothetical protein